MDGARNSPLDPAANGRLPVHHIQRVIVATLQEAHLGTEILRQVGTLQGRPYLGIAVQ